MNGMLDPAVVAELQKYLEQFQPSEDDRRQARGLGLLGAGLSILGAPRGYEMQAIGQGGLLGVQAYRNELADLTKQRTQNLSAAMQVAQMARRLNAPRTLDEPLPGAGPATPAAPPEPYGPGVGAAFGMPPGAAPPAPPVAPPQPRTRREQLRAMGVPDAAIDWALQQEDPNKALFDLASKFGEPRVAGNMLLGPGGKIMGGAIAKDTLPIEPGPNGPVARPVPNAQSYFTAGTAAEEEAKRRAEAKYSTLEIPVGNQKAVVGKLDYLERGRPEVPPPNAIYNGTVRPQDVTGKVFRPTPDMSPGLPQANLSGGGYSMGGYGISADPLAVKSAEGRITAQTAQDTKVAEGFGADYLKAIEAERQAPVAIAKYQRLGEYLGQVQTGKIAPSVQALKAFVASIPGLQDVAKDWTGDVPYAQAAQALSREIALQLRNPAGGAGMPGNMSDQDRNYLESMIAGLSNDPRSIPYMLEARIKVEQRAQEVGALARQYRQKHGKIDEGFYEAVREYADTHPLFSPLPPAPTGTAAPASGGNRPLTPAEQAELARLKKKYGR